MPECLIKNAVLVIPVDIILNCYSNNSNLSLLEKSKCHRFEIFKELTGSSTKMWKKYSIENSLIIIL